MRKVIEEKAKIADFCIKKAENSALPSAAEQRLSIE